MPGCIHPAFARGRKVSRCRKTHKTTAGLRGGRIDKSFVNKVLKPVVKKVVKPVVKPVAKFAKDNMANVAGCIAGSAGSCAIVEKNLSKVGESAVSSLQKLGQKNVQKVIKKGKKYVEGQVKSTLGQAKEATRNVIQQGNNLTKGLSTKQIIQELMIENPQVISAIAQEVQN